MTLEELVSFVRSDYLDDVNPSPYLWSDAQLLRYANEACLEAAMRAPLITRTYTKAIAIDNPDVVLDVSVRRILNAKLASDTQPLIQTTNSDLVFNNPSWKEVKGSPHYYVRNATKFRLYPIPIEADTLVLDTTNVPDDDFDFEEDIDPAYQKDLAYWMVYKAYLLRDEETYNPMKAKEFYILFEQAFGIKHSAKYDKALFNAPVNPRMTGGRMC